MDQNTVNDTVNDAASRLMDLLSPVRNMKATDVAELVKILNLVHSDGYKYGLHQGHVDYQPGGVFNPDSADPARQQINYRLLAQRIQDSAGSVIFTNWGDRPLSEGELTAVLRDRIKNRPADGGGAQPAHS